MKNNAAPRVLAIILNYATYKLTLSLIPELRKLNYPELDILVVDNNSPNESAHILQKHKKELGFQFIASRENGGYAKGNNIGITYAVQNGYDYSLILNNDVLLKDTQVLRHMVDIAERDCQIGCVGPKIYTSNGSVCAPYCNRYTLWSMTLGIFQDKMYRNSQKDISREVYRVYGCCMLLKNSFMKEIDGMDDRTFLYGEEAILSERLMKVNSTTYYDAGVSVIHNESSTVKQAGKKQIMKLIKEQSRSRYIYLKDYRHFGCVRIFLCNLVGNAIILFRH